MRLGKIETMEEVGGKTNEKKLVWFAMSAPYCKELEAQQLLEREYIESFVPLCYKIVKRRDGQKKRVLKPAIPNYIFVRTTRSILQEVKNRILILQYLTRRENGKNIPIIVPDYQMEQFIRVINTYNENLVFLKPEEVNLKKGTPVRIVGGAFDGKVWDVCFRLCLSFSSKNVCFFMYLWNDCFIPLQAILLAWRFPRSYR